MHGEFKVPKGKLVVVDLEIEGNSLRDVRLTGDFFLYPEEALEPLTASLEGAPAGEAEATYEQLVAEAVPEDAELLGFSPQAIAVAVVRAQRECATEVTDA